MKKEKVKTELLIHDLKTPLAVIQTGLAGLLTRQKQYGTVSEKQERVLKRLLRNVRAAQMMVSDALELGRSESGGIHRLEVPVGVMVKQVLMDVFDLVDSRVSEKMKSLNSLAEISGLVSSSGLKIRMEEVLWKKTRFLDEPKTRQILRNLLTNAFKYRKTGVELTVASAKGQMTFSVRDDGDGIPAAYHQRIFDCYFQLAPDNCQTVRGHGVGLAGALVLAGDLGGRLELISDSGKGAEFVVTLPC